MNLDRSEPPRVLDLQVRTARTQERMEQAIATPSPPVRPEHGGVTASERPENRATGDALARDRKRRALASLRKKLRLPDDADLDVELDARSQPVTFRLVDRRTGAVLREIPEAEAGELVDALHAIPGGLIDRSS
jgi:uncharacterized FlaG/YvyC family protein